MRRLLAIVVVALAGCAGEADLGELRSAVVGPPLPSEAWSDAPASCASVTGRRVRATHVPELVALVDLEGRVLCVDLLELVAAEQPQLFVYTGIDAAPWPRALEGGPLSSPTSAERDPTGEPTSSRTDDPRPIP